MVTNSAMIARMKVDSYFHGLIWQRYGVDLFGGMTTADERQARIAKFIVERALADEYLNPKARPGVARETWCQAFERGYRAKLLAA